MTNSHKLQDFYCASFLVASGFKLSGTASAEGRTIFEFDDMPDIEESIHKYYSLTATINPVAYGNAIRNLKSIIHTNSNQNKTNYYVKQPTELNYSIC